MAEQQADFAVQQASLALQQSATWTPAFAVVFVAQQEQVFAAASRVDSGARLMCAAAQQALLSAQQLWPFLQHSALPAP
ncbi:MAG TPA: hypothetical protein VG055_30050 [Planctomycetaceae bacterium]|nr:hypothetical protein [Planctomycetaceae bacterium]